MTHTVHTGKSSGTTVKVGATAIGRWKQIVIKEAGRPIPADVDVTNAASSAFTYIDDPLGGTGTAKCSITVSGLKPRTDKFSSGILTGTAPGATVTVTVQKGTGAGKDLFTMTDGRYMGLKVPAEIATVVPYTAAFELDSSAGVWSASLS